MNACGFPAQDSDVCGEYRGQRFYPVPPGDQYDEKGAQAGYSPYGWGRRTKMIYLGGRPRATAPEAGASTASLLLLSPTGELRPSLLHALDRDERLCVRRGALPQSAETVDNADVVVIDATESVTAGIDALVSVRRRSGVPVMFVAGADCGSQAVMALNLGADDFVIEPF